MICCRIPLGDMTMDGLMWFFGDVRVLKTGQCQKRGRCAVALLEFRIRIHKNVMREIICAEFRFQSTQGIVCFLCDLNSFALNCHGGLGYEQEPTDLSIGRLTPGIDMP